MKTEHHQRVELACRLAKQAGALALAAFMTPLEIKMKGRQDFVSNADLEVENFLRDEILKAFPDDGLVGEEFGTAAGKSGYEWVLDPIDGTANFVRSIPLWCVVIALVHGDRVVGGVIYDPNHDELFWAERGQGAFMNDESLKFHNDIDMGDGTVAFGYSTRVKSGSVPKLVEAFEEDGAFFVRMASGALSLAWVAASRYNGYIEEVMNAWDCFAGMILVEEAGGKTSLGDVQAMIRDGGRVIAGPLGVYDRLEQIGHDLWK